MFAVLLLSLSSPPQFTVENHIPKFTVVNLIPAARVVAAPTFRSGDYHAGHDCPNCHRIETDKDDDSGPTHTHRCESCGTVWWHNDRSTVSSGPALRRIFGTGRFR